MSTTCRSSGATSWRSRLRPATTSASFRSRATWWRARCAARDSTPSTANSRKIYRKAKPYDIEKWQEAIALEHETMIASRQIAADMGLNMKIGDVEYQGDKIKAIFYYIADERVDFRELIKVFAERFHIRIEMKQIGARQEAGTHRRTGCLRTRVVLRIVDVEFFERHDRRRPRTGNFAQSPETRRTMLEAQVLHDVRVRHLRRRPQGVPASARTAAGHGRRILSWSRTTFWPAR